MKQAHSIMFMVLGALSLHTVPIEAMTQQALQKTQDARAWIANNKGKLVALGIAIAAALGASYLASKDGSPVDRVFQNKKVELSSDENIRNTQYMLGYTAYEKGVDGLKRLLSKPTNYRQIAVMLQGFKNLDAALAELAGISLDEFNTMVRYARRNIILP